MLNQVSAFLPHTQHTPSLNSAQRYRALRTKIARHKNSFSPPGHIPEQHITHPSTVHLYIITDDSLSISIRPSVNVYLCLIELFCSVLNLSPVVLLKTINRYRISFLLEMYYFVYPVSRLIDCRVNRDISGHYIFIYLLPMYSNTKQYSIFIK